MRLVTMYQGFIKFLISAVLALTANFAFAVDEIIADKHYKVLPQSYSSNPEIAQFRANDQGKVQALFFFNYGCHICNMLNKPFDEWAAKNSEIASYHIPVTSRGLESLTKAYYVAKELDPSGKIDDAIFAGIHQKRINYSRKSLLQKLFVEYGISKKDFELSWDSFSVARQLHNSIDLVAAYKINATPIIIINGKDKIYLTNLVITKDEETLLKTLNFIIKKEQG